MKLTNAMKDRIITSILNSTFEAREAAIQSDRHTLADLIYHDFYDQYISAMKKLPETFFCQKSSIGVVFASSGCRECLDMPGTKLTAKIHEWSGFNFPEDHRFTADFRAIQAKESALSKDRKTLHDTLKSIILPVTTDKRLVEVWPDAEKWIPRTPAAMSNLPAVRPEDINALIAQMKG